MRQFRILVMLLSALVVADAAWAHEFWVQPSTFQPRPESILTIGLRVGEQFRGQVVARDSSKIERFVIAGPQGEQEVVGRDGTDPAGLVRVGSHGTYVIGYMSTPSSIELDAAKFEQYLLEDGLETIIALRAERGESEKDGKEIYSRCAKSIVSVGDSGSEGYDRLLGLTLELVPERNPLTSSEDNMPFRLLYQGKPCPGVLVVAVNRDEPDRKLTTRSDEAGRLEFRLDRAGMWLVSAVHMVTAPHASDADWESIWASLTFEKERSDSTKTTNDAERNGPLKDRPGYAPNGSIR